ncbi:protein kinase [Polyrhizophydium stewartii]|uniref:Protein kinase n=1 Tax=Polyrhizophydium stewartii TaxID=2732419 RepID=A0ABR4N967_9FUNG
MSSRRTLAGEGRSGPASSSAGASHADRAESARGASARDAGKASSSAGQTTGVVELAALENHKENIQPLRSGHSAAALAERYADQAEPASDSRSAAAPRASGRRAGAPPASAPAPAASHSVSESRNRLEAECAQREAALARVPDTADDPLDAYVQHVRWVEQHLSTDHASYMRTLEAAMRRFRKDVRYSNDLRHLQLWIRVARRTATPIDIFKYLSVNNIGQVFALYYEEYAAMMETNQRFDEARTILQEGIAKRAQPIDRLTRLLSEFEKRRADAEAEGTAADDAGEADDGQSENGPRQPLARVSGSSRGIASKSNAWSSIDTEEQRRKENVREATKWAGATLPQKQPAVLPIEKMEVFHDESPAKPPARSGNPSLKLQEVPVRASVSVVRALERESMPEPSSQLSAPQQSSSQRPSSQLTEQRRPSSKISKNGTAAPALQSAAAAEPERKKPPTGPAAYGWRQDLVIVDGVERSLEEARASLPRYQFVPIKQESPTRFVDAEIDEDKEYGSRSIIEPDSPTHSASHGISESTAAAAAAAAAAIVAASPIRRTSPTAASSGSQPPKARQVASPTINTKAAMADIFEMFSAPLAGEDSGADADSATQRGTAADASGSAAPGTAWDDEDETISSRVYRPSADQLKIGVFRDSDDDGAYVSEAQQQQQQQHHAPPARDSVRGESRPALGRADRADRSRSGRAFGVHPDENAQSTRIRVPLSEEPGLRSRSGAAGGDSAAGASGRRPLQMQTHSTPYHAARKSDALGEAGTTQRTGIGSEGMPGVRTRVVLGRQLDPMTPITEANSELDRTIGGLSTVRSRGTLSGASATILEEPDDTMAYRQGATSDGFGAMLGGASTSADVFNSFHFNPEDADPQSHFAILADAKDEYDDSEQPCAAQDVQGARQKARQLAARSLQVDNPCDPYTSEVRSKLLAEWQSRDDFGVTVPAFVAAQAPMPNLHEIARNKLPAEIALNHFGTLSVIGRLGNGGYGHVLLVRREMDSLQDLLEDNIEDLLNDDLDDLDEESDARTSAKASKTPGNDMFAIKIQSPPSLWEHYILSHVERRLHARARRSVVRCHSAHQFQNATCLVLDHCRYGSILDALNSDPSSTFLVDGAGFNEALAMFWTIEMLRVVESLHAARIVHGDIKADNLMLRFDSDAGRQAAILESQYHADGSGGWEHRGLVLIDWGQAIDLECFDDGQMFITPAAGNAGAAPELVARKRASLARAGRSTTAFDEAVECLEVRTGRPWRHQPDWYGIAGVAHLMLFRADMQVAAQEKDGSAGMSVHLSIKRPFKRQWQTALWSRLFDVLLNSGAYGDTVLTEVAAVRSDMQVWLEGASTKGSTMLRGLLNAVQSAAMERRRGTAR